MIKINYKKIFIRIENIWAFGENVEKSIYKNDISFIHHISPKENIVKNAIIYPQKTLITDITQDIEYLFNNINKNFRYEINRSNKEDFIYQTFFGYELKDLEVVSKFVKDYREFTRLKKIKNTLNYRALLKYIESNSILLTRHIYMDTVLASHIYVIDISGGNARLLYSLSKFRNDDLNSTFVGIANKSLHWKDILFLKNNAVSKLDWGGIMSFDSPTGVDLFKMKFGGQRVYINNCIFGTSLIGKVIIYIRKLMTYVFS